MVLETQSETISCFFQQSTWRRPQRGITKVLKLLDCGEDVVVSPCYPVLWEFLFSERSFWKELGAKISKKIAIGYPWPWINHQGWLWHGLGLLCWLLGQQQWSYVLWFIPQCHYQRDINHIHCTNKISELSCWALTMKVQMRHNTAKAGRHYLAHLCTWRGVPLVASLSRVLKVVGFKNFVWSPLKQQGNRNYFPIHPNPDYWAHLTELTKAGRNGHP